MKEEGGFLFPPPLLFRQNLFPKRWRGEREKVCLEKEGVAWRKKLKCIAVGHANSTKGFPFPYFFVGKKSFIRILTAVLRSRQQKDPKIGFGFKVQDH